MGLYIKVDGDRRMTCPFLKYQASSTTCEGPGCMAWVKLLTAILLSKVIV